MAGDVSSLDQIPQPNRVPVATSADGEMELAAYSKLGAPGKAEYQHRKLVKHLCAERDGIHAECCRLRAINEHQSPKLAQLEHAAEVSRAVARDGTGAVTLGGLAVGVAGFFADESLRWVVCGLGGGLTISGLWLLKILNGLCWPRQNAKTPTPKEPSSTEQPR